MISAHAERYETGHPLRRGRAPASRAESHKRAELSGGQQQRVAVARAGDELGDDGGNAAPTVIVLAEIFAGGLQVDQERQVVAMLLPVRDLQLDAEVACDRVQIRWMGAFVEPPIAVLTAMAFSNARRVMTLDGVRSSCTMPTMRRPVSHAIWPRSR